MIVKMDVEVVAIIIICWSKTSTLIVDRVPVGSNKMVDLFLDKSIHSSVPLSSPSGRACGILILEVIITRRNIIIIDVDLSWRSLDRSCVVVGLHRRQI